MGTGPAEAASNPQLQSLIIHDPVAHGQQIPASAANSDATDLLQGIGVFPPHKGVSFAATGWTYGPSSGASSLLIVLISLARPGKSESYLDKWSALDAQYLASDLCYEVLGPNQNGPSAHRATAPGIGNGHYFQCDPSQGDAQNGMTLARGHVFALLLSTTKTFSKSVIEAIARRQYASLGSER
jgi:hypothetical protein